jgi:uncharacterized caspase-like protein
MGGVAVSARPSWWLAIAMALVLTVVARAAQAESVRILVAVGSRVGLADERPLKHADTDAAQVRAVMVDRGGVRPDDAIVLAVPSRAQLFAAIDRARARAQQHKVEDVTLFFYFSGHGDREALHVGDDRVLLADLTSKLAEVPAALRIAVTDACRTNREKGFAPDEPFAISSTTNTQTTGQVWIHASGEGEAAQESDELQGAIFTHAWLSGLRGGADANGDARVTLDESFAFAHSQTLIRSARSSGVLQKPEAVVNLRELAPVVLTQTATQMATLSLPMARDTHFLVYAAESKSVLSELWGFPERRIALAVPPGRYVVQRRFAGTGGVARIAMTAGEQRELVESDFRASSLEALAAKGDADVAAPAPAPTSQAAYELSVGYAIGADTRTGVVQGARVDSAFAWRSTAAITLGAQVDFAGRTTSASASAITEHLVRGTATAGAELRVPLGPETLRLGAAARAGWLTQTLRPAGTSNGAFVAGPELSAVVRSPLGAVAFADLGVTGNVLLFKEADKTRAVPAVMGGASVGMRF